MSEKSSGGSPERTEFASSDELQSLHARLTVLADKLLAPPTYAMGTPRLTLMKDGAPDVRPFFTDFAPYRSIIVPHHVVSRVAPAVSASVAEVHVNRYDPYYTLRPGAQPSPESGRVRISDVDGIDGSATMGWRHVHGLPRIETFVAPDMEQESWTRRPTDKDAGGEEHRAGVLATTYRIANEVMTGLESMDPMLLRAFITVEPME